MKIEGQPIGVRKKKGKVWGQCEHMPWGLFPSTVTDIRLLMSEGWGYAWGLEDTTLDSGPY